MPDTSKFYSSDQPISSRTEDRFNRWPFAQRIAETIASREDVSSLVIGIYGPWGDGKTSVLRLMEEAFAEYDSIVPVHFNPWLFPSESQLVASFFKTVADALGKKLKKKTEEIGKFLEEYGSLLSLASISILGGAVSFKPDEAVRQVGKTLSAVKLDQLKDRIEAILAKSGKRVVVLIDDIDRLERQETQAIFKLVKLSASFENISYVLAFDDEVVASALSEKYGAGGVEAGRDFLEKIVQVPLHLPPADRLALRQLLFEGIDATLSQAELTLAEDDARDFARSFQDGLEIRLKTPRQAKRYANALAFGIPILKGEVHPVDQMLIEGMRIFYPALYETVRQNPSVFLGSASWERNDDERRKRHLKILEAGLMDLDSAEQAAAKDLLKVLFPRLKAMFGNTYYDSDWDRRWRDQQRLCSSRYFARYFQYAIPTGDVPDKAIDDLLAVAELSPLAVEEHLKQSTASAGAAQKLVEKLRAREKTIEMASAKNIALAVSRNGGLFPEEQVIFGAVMSTSAQASILVLQLVKLVPIGEERESFAAELIRTAEPLPFAAQCFYWLSFDERHPDNAVSSVSSEQLGQILAARIRAAAEKRPLYEEWPDGAAALFYRWTEFGDAGEVASYLERRFSQYPEDVPRFLICFSTKAVSLSSGIWYRADFEHHSYSAVTGLVSADLIMNCLRSIYGMALEAPRFHGPDRRRPEESVAHQFAFLHAKAQESMKET
jgi:KAP family P-loop domain